jgi:hypothetical protein
LIDQVARPAQLDTLRSGVAAESSDGRRVALDPYDNPVCSIRFNAPANCIDVVWKMYATSLQLRFIHECMLDLIDSCGATGILGDDTSLGIIHGDDEAWLAHDWLPRAMAAGVQAGASKTPSTYFAAASIRRIHSAAPSGLRLGRFPDLTEARAWLSSGLQPPATA